MTLAAKNQKKKKPSHLAYFIKERRGAKNPMSIKARKLKTKRAED